MTSGMGSGSQSPPTLCINDSTVSSTECRFRRTHSKIPPLVPELSKREADVKEFASQNQQSAFLDARWRFDIVGVITDKTSGTVYQSNIRLGRLGTDGRSCRRLGRDSDFIAGPVSPGGISLLRSRFASDSSSRFSFTSWSMF